MKEINFKSKEAIESYASAVTNGIHNVIRGLDEEYNNSASVSRTRYDILKSGKTYLSFLIRRAERQLKEEKENIFNSKNLQLARERINYLYRVLGETIYKIDFYSNCVAKEKTLTK